MLQIFPFLRWLAPIASAVMLILLWRDAEIPRWAGTIGLVSLLLAGYLQFFAGSPVASAVGLLLQTLLAIALFLRWRVSG